MTTLGDYFKTVSIFCSAVQIAREEEIKELEKTLKEYEDAYKGVLPGPGYRLGVIEYNMLAGDVRKRLAALKEK